VNSIDLEKAHIASQEKYSYFLLAAAGAAIAFALQKTEHLSLSWWISPIAIALLCWISSFFFGCKNIVWHQAILRTEIYIARVIETPESELSHNQKRQSISNHANEMDKKLKKYAYAKWQFLLLIAGAAALSCSYLMDLVRRSI
jgi:hypothetical protein